MRFSCRARRHIAGPEAETPAYFADAVTSGPCFLGIETTDMNFQEKSGNVCAG